MKEYMIGVFAISAVIGLCGLISYKERGDSARRFAFAVLLLYTVASPLGELIKDIDGGFLSGDINFNPEDYGADYAEVAEEAFIEGVRSMICSKYSLVAEEVRVIPEGFDFSSMKARRIKVILSGRASLADYKAIEKYVNECDIGECDAEIEIG